MEDEIKEADRPASGDRGVAAKWIDELAASERWQQEFEEEGDRIIERWKCAVQDRGWSKRPHYNIFWANTQILQPTLYARTPKAQVERRFKASDNLARKAGMLLERATQFSIDNHQDFDHVAKQSRDDRLIPGRGILREDYVPTMGMVTKEVQLPDGSVQQQEVEDIVYEESVTRHWYWKDVRHNPCRWWEEVRWIAFKNYFTRSEAEKRFPNYARDIVYDYLPAGADPKAPEQINSRLKKAVIWEIWDKDSRKVYWVCDSYKDSVLDEKEDPYRLKNFFPCARFLDASLFTDKYLPIADYTQYRDLANEVDMLTERIEKITDSIRNNYVYHKAFYSVLNDLYSKDNAGIPVDNWADFASKGGFSGVLQFIENKDQAATLQVLMEQRDSAIQKIYEITGMSDIIRGASDPRETATAQQLKGQYGSLRVKDKQADMQRFLRDQIAIKAEIIAEHFRPETLALIAGEEFAMDPELPQVVELLRNDVLRTYKVDIETDSIIEIDEQAERQSRTEYLQAVGSFFSDGLPMVQQLPALLPYFGQAISFLSRSYRAGREMEEVLEQTLAAIQQEAQAAAQNQGGPSPEEMQAQVEAQMKQQEAQTNAMLQQQDLQYKAQVEQLKASLKERELQMKQEIEQQKILFQQQMEQQKLEVQVALESEKIRSQEAISAAKLDADMQKQRRDEVMQALQMASASAGKEIAQPNKPADDKPRKKRVVFGYDENGNRTADIEEVREAL